MSQPISSRPTPPGSFKPSTDPTAGVFTITPPRMFQRPPAATGRRWHLFLNKLARSPTIPAPSVSRSADKRRTFNEGLAHPPAAPRFPPHRTLASVPPHYFDLNLATALPKHLTLAQLLPNQFSGKSRSKSKKSLKEGVTKAKFIMFQFIDEF